MNITPHLDGLYCNYWLADIALRERDGSRTVIEKWIARFKGQEDKWGSYEFERQAPSVVLYELLRNLDDHSPGGNESSMYTALGWHPKQVVLTSYTVTRIENGTYEITLEYTNKPLYAPGQMRLSWTVEARQEPMYGKDLGDRKIKAEISQEVIRVKMLPALVVERVQTSLLANGEKEWVWDYLMYRNSGDIAVPLPGGNDSIYIWTGEEKAVLFYNLNISPLSPDAGCLPVYGGAESGESAYWALNAMRGVNFSYLWLVKYYFLIEGADPIWEGKTMEGSAEAGYHNVKVYERLLSTKQDYRDRVWCFEVYDTADLSEAFSVEPETFPVEHYLLPGINNPYANEVVRKTGTF